MTNTKGLVAVAEQAFAAAQDQRSANEASWLQDLRNKAKARFETLGVPHRKHEEWKYTSLRDLNSQPLKVQLTPGTQEPSAEALQERATGSWGKNTLVFVDGFFSDSLSSMEAIPAGVTLGTWREISTQEAWSGRLEQALSRQFDRGDAHPFAALNLALFGDGVVLHVPRNAVVEEPIHVLYVTSPGQAETKSAIRNLLVLEESAQATVVERFLGMEEGAYFTNTVTEVEVAANASLDHYKIQEEGPAATHIANIHVEMERDSRFSSLSLSLGGLLERNDVDAGLNGTGIECTLNGFYHARGKQHIDNHTSIDHRKPHCNSFETYKGVLDGKGKGVFNGKIFVQQEAQKTDAKQNNQALLLSDDAQIFSKPQLEIFADDVKCTHGATSGNLDKESLFYLRSRGIAMKEAKALLTYAFANELVTGIKPEALREEMEGLLARRFRADHGDNENNGDA